MAKEKTKTYECRVCGRKVDVTRTGNVYEEPVYCCGVETKEIKGVPKVSVDSTNKRTPKPIRNLSSGLSYCGEVQSKRQVYYVFESKKCYVLLSLSLQKKNAGNFNITDKGIVDYVAKLVRKKKGITSKQVVKMSKKPHAITATLDSLNMLYVLVATQRASIDRRIKGKELHFNCR